MTYSHLDWNLPDDIDFDEIERNALRMRAEMMRLIVRSIGGFMARPFRRLRRRSERPAT